jgi:hypothetical protein
MKKKKLFYRRVKLFTGNVTASSIEAIELISATFGQHIPVWMSYIYYRASFGDNVSSSIDDAFSSYDDIASPREDIEHFLKGILLLLMRIVSFFRR